MIGELLKAGMSIIDKVVGDPQAKAEAKLALLQLEQSGDLAVIAGQVEINKIEAASPSLFKSGWRPALGWTCVAGFALTVFSPLLTWAAALAGHPVAIPPIPTEGMLPLLFGMLGLGGMRTMEKLNNAEGNRS